MKIVLDTNVLLVSIPKKSLYRVIFDSLLTNKFELTISNDKHFNSLKNMEFPKLSLLSIDEFMELLVT